MIFTNHVQRILFSWNKVVLYTILPRLMKTLRSCCKYFLNKGKDLIVLIVLTRFDSLCSHTLWRHSVPGRISALTLSLLTMTFPSGLSCIRKFFQQENLATTQGETIGQLQGPQQLRGSESSSQKQLLRSKSHHLSTSPSSLPYTHQQQPIGPQLAGTLFFLFNSLQGGLSH